MPRQSDKTKLGESCPDQNGPRTLPSPHCAYALTGCFDGVIGSFDGGGQLPPSAWFLEAHRDLTVASEATSAPHPFHPQGLPPGEPIQGVPGSLLQSGYA